MRAVLDPRTYRRLRPARGKDIVILADAVNQLAMQVELLLHQGTNARYGGRPIRTVLKLREDVAELIPE